MHPMTGRKATVNVHFTQMSELTGIQCDVKKKQENRDRMLKAAGSMCVLAACIGFVRELLRTGSLHKEYLEALIELTELLSAEIRYERLPIQEALQQIQKKIRPEIAFVLRQMIEQMKDGTGTPFSEIWEQAFRKGGKELFLTGEELEEVCRIGKHLDFWTRDSRRSICRDVGNGCSVC